MILAIVILGTISARGLFGGVIVTLFGFKYTSVWMVILFFIIASFVSYPISLFAEALPNVLYIEFGKLTLFQAQLLFLILDTISTAIGIVFVDLFMKSVSALDLAILIVSFIFALMGVKDIGEKKATTISNQMKYNKSEQKFEFVYQYIWNRNQDISPSTCRVCKMLV